MSTARSAVSDTESALVPVVLLDRLPRGEAIDLVRGCLASDRWARELVSGRPYTVLRRVVDASDDILSDLAWSDILEGLSILRPDPSGSPALREATLRYERRFGHTLVLPPAARTDADRLAAITDRLRDGAETHRAAVCRDLREVLRLRLVTTLR